MVWVRVRLGITNLNDNQVVLAGIRDITKEKAKDRRLRLFYQVLRHNLRNDMNVIKGYAEMLQESIENDSLVQQLNVIRQTADELESVSRSIRQIEEIVDLERAARSPTNLREEVRSVVTEIQKRHSVGNIEVDVDDSIWIDTSHGLKYAIREAIVNAIRHDKRSEAEILISISAQDRDAEAEIQSTDTGLGIPEIELASFDETVESTDTYHGIGVGLWMMKWCVETLGGELTFEAREPTSTIVHMRIPQCDSPHASRGDDE